MTIKQLEENAGFTLPKRYCEFVSGITPGDVYEIGETGICLYNLDDLPERNDTYEIPEYEPNYFMIGQEGDLGFFIKKDNQENIYSNDLGAVGSLEMKFAASDINEFINNIN